MEDNEHHEDSIVDISILNTYFSMRTKTRQESKL